MTKQRQACEKLIMEELADIIEQHGMFATEHDGFGVIREQLREAHREYKEAKTGLKNLEDAIWLRSDSIAIKAADQIDIAATRLVIEAMQVAATARKYKATFGTQKT